MNCTHDRLRCTNNVYFCQDCGQRVAWPASGAADDKQQGQEKKPAERPPEAKKRTRRKNPVD